MAESVATCNNRRFTSMPNFRRVGCCSRCINKSKLENSWTSTSSDDAEAELGEKNCTGINLYRSSRPDFLTEEELIEFMQIGIRSIIDLRSAVEYSKANGEKLLDGFYPLSEVKLPFGPCYKVGDTLEYRPGEVHQRSFEGRPRSVEGHERSGLSNSTENGSIAEQGCRRQFSCSNGNSFEDGCTTDNGLNHTPSRRHFLINFFKLQYKLAVFFKPPWYIQLYCLPYLLIDVALRTDYRYFTHLYSKHVLNSEGLYGQYVNMIDNSQAAIYAALKLLCEKDNLPAMLNCAHGKDRTGIISALVLACLGKSKHFIATDYALSEIELKPMRDRMKAEIMDRYNFNEDFIMANYDTMMRLLQYIDTKYGSIEEYLERISFTRSDQQRLAANLQSCPSPCTITATVPSATRGLADGASVLHLD